MLLDIIVPHYDEPWSVVRPFFDILSCQKGVDFNDFRVLLIHDGVPSFPDEYFNNSDRPMNVVQCCVPHKGVSAARNYGIDNATAEWVAFCDCDDSYSSIFSLKMIFHSLKDGNDFDLLRCKFYIDGMSVGKPLGKSNNFNDVFIHNKYYRLSFLKEHDIRFNENLFMSEDSAFNTLVKLELKPNRDGTIDSSEPLYSWCRRTGSITMDFSRWLKNTEGHFDRNVYVLSEYRKHKALGSDLVIARTITDAYSMMTKAGIFGDFGPMIEKISRFYKQNKKIFETVTKSNVLKALEASDKDSGITEEEKRNRIPLDEWLKRI